MNFPSIHTYNLNEARFMHPLYASKRDFYFAVHVGFQTTHMPYIPRVGVSRDCWLSAGGSVFPLFCRIPHLFPHDPALYYAAVLLLYWVGGILVHSITGRCAGWSTEGGLSGRTSRRSCSSAASASSIDRCSSVTGETSPVNVFFTLLHEACLSWRTSLPG